MTSGSRDGLRLDPLHLFAVSVAGLLAAAFFFLAALAGVSLETAATRGVISWTVLSALGIGLAMLVRWILRAPPPGPRRPSLDLTLPATDDGATRADITR